MSLISSSEYYIITKESSRPVCWAGTFFLKKVSNFLFLIKARTIDIIAPLLFLSIYFYLVFFYKKGCYCGPYLVFFYKKGCYCGSYLVFFYKKRCYCRTYLVFFYKLLVH